jgi:hypothetical protein
VVSDIETLSDSGADLSIKNNDNETFVEISCRQEKPSNTYKSITESLVLKMMLDNPDSDDSQMRL